VAKNIIRVFRFKRKNIFLFTVGIVLAAVIINLYNIYAENRYIAALSWTVAGRIIVIDPGHGGIDPGAKGKNGGVEKEITLEVSKRLADLFTQAGAKVILTRQNDTDLSDPGSGSLLARKRQDLTRRVAMANERNADLFLSIHVNSFVSDPGQKGAQTFTQPGSVESKEISEAIQAELSSFLHNSKRKAKEVDYFTTRIARVPAVIVEIGFVSNPQEESAMVKPDYQSKIAWTIYSGVVKYYAQKAS
jgi:N-acetylmuramoyl-L-alanine amidase